MNKKIPFPIAIIIIVVCAVLVGIIVWQYGFILRIGPSGLSPRPPEKEVTIATDKTEYEQGETVGAPEKEVVITTNKTEYEQGETVEITISNGLEQPIWYVGESPYPSCCTLFKWEENKWVNLGVPFNVKQVVPPASYSGPSPIDAEELKPGESIHKEWNMKMGEWSERFLEKGKYRFGFYYGLSKKNYTEIIYSNEFTIK